MKNSYSPPIIRRVVRVKSLSILLTFNLIFLGFFGLIVGATMDLRNAEGEEPLNFSTQVCSDWANESNIDLHSILFGGENFTGDPFLEIPNPSSFQIIETEQQFLTILSTSNNKIISGTNLFFPHDIRIDLSHEYGIVIEENVTLLGSRGYQGKIGASFMTKSFAEPANYSNQKPLFLIKGNNVTISGLIFAGPVPVGDIGDFDWKEGRFGLEVKHGLETEESYVLIRNNEFYGFGHAGISIENTFTSNIQSSNVIIEHNFIHDHMQFQSGISGTGYGVVINNAYPLIRYNEFGLNRHDVAHTGYFHAEGSKYLSGYEFSFNLLHLGATDHMVDLHCYGKENSTNCEDHAGDFMYVHNNLFYDPQVAIAIRGAPTIGVCIHDNEFLVSESQFLERKGSSGDLGHVVSFDNSFSQQNNYVREDADGDGVGDRSDSDDDNDGTSDFYDAFPLNSSESLDTDSDRIGNNADLDDDGDMVLDADDVFPLNSSESLDTDSDGIGNNADLDDDGDLVLDVDDAFPLNSSESQDTDSDVTIEKSVKESEKLLEVLPPSVLVIMLIMMMIGLKTRNYSRPNQEGQMFDSLQDDE